MMIFSRIKFTKAAHAAAPRGHQTARSRQLSENTSFGLHRTSIKQMFRSIVVVVSSLIATQSYGVIKPSEPAGLPDYDIRTTVSTPSVPTSSPTMAPTAPDANRTQAEARLKELVPDVKVDRDKLLGVPRLISARRGFLSGPNGIGKGVSATQLNALPTADTHRVVKAFVNEYSALFGHDAAVFDSARVKRDSVTQQNGLRTTVWEQTVGEIPVFDGLFVANVTGIGELVNLQSHFVPNAVAAADRGAPEWRSGPSVSAAQAVATAAENIGGQIEESLIEIAQQPEGAERKQILQGEGLTGPAWTELVWLPMGRDSMRLCWRIIFTPLPQLSRYMVLVDAETREVLLRRSLTVHLKAASFNVYTNDSPSPFSPAWPTPTTNQPPTTNRFLVLLPNGALDTNASPAGWIDDNNTNNNTIGNNADAFLDRDYNQVPDQARPNGGASRVFNFPLNLT